MNYGASKVPLRQYFSRDRVNAVWDWSNPMTKTQKDLKSISDFMYLHQLTAVYVDVGQYEQFINSPLSEKEKSDKQKFEQSLKNYIKELGKRNIQVYAAAGNTDWSTPPLRHIPISILELVHAYNEEHPDAAFAGMQFDIESYNQEGFAEGSTTVKALVLEDFLDTVDRLLTASELYNESNNTTFGLGFAIPYWFDNENGNIPVVTWRNKTGPALYHLMDRLNMSPNNNVVVMAYRNAARGNDGIIAHSRSEVDYARAVAPNVSVVIGQEVNDVEPAKITYFGSTTTKLSNEIGFTKEAFGDTEQFRGIAINDLDGFRQLEADER
jgi:hypothetical protein